MKDLFKNGVVILLIIAALYILYLRECKRIQPCPAEDEMIIKLAVWDSLQALADLPPEVRIDTFYLKGDIVYLPSEPLPLPIPDPVDTTINNYADSLINKEINVWYDFKVKGMLLEREWSYKPITTLVTIDSIIYVPKVVDNIKEVVISKSGFYIYGAAGGNSNSFLFGGGLDLITKKETMIGYQYQKFGDDGFHSVRIGARLFKKP